MSQLDAKRQEIFLQYDPLKRLSQKDYTKTKPLSRGDIVLEYDNCPNGIGRTCLARNQYEVTSFSYDALGRVSGETRLLRGKSYTFSRTYDSDGRFGGLHHRYAVAA
jgi:YD repeat-containing protein